MKLLLSFLYIDLWYLLFITITAENPIMHKWDIVKGIKIFSLIEFRYSLSVERILVPRKFQHFLQQNIFKHSVRFKSCSVKREKKFWDNKLIRGNSGEQSWPLEFSWPFPCRKIWICIDVIRMRDTFVITTVKCSNIAGLCVHSFHVQAKFIE